MGLCNSFPVNYLSGFVIYPVPSFSGRYVEVRGEVHCICEAIPDRYQPSDRQKEISLFNTIINQVGTGFESGQKILAF
jgi:hypothetical protein